MRALVIDDSRAMRRIITNILVEVGFEVTEAEHGAEALERLEELGSMELALVDWNMPVMDGLEFVRKVRADRSHDQMKIMMVTTETGAEEMTTALESGADEYVMKPFTKDSIAAKLSMLAFEPSRSRGRWES